MCNFHRNLCLGQNSEDVCARELFVFSAQNSDKQGGEVHEFEEGKSGGRGKFNSLEILEDK